MRPATLAAALLAVLAAGVPPAGAAPVLDVTPTAVALSPTQTLLTLRVDPNGTALTSLVFDLSALASGLEIVAAASLAPDVVAEAPSLSGGDWIAGFTALFAGERTAPFDVGTLTLEGLVAGTPLVLSGGYTGAAPGFADLPVAPSAIATVVPEPAAGALLAQGLLLLAARGRRGR